MCHADVQPVDPLDLWDTPPFEPTVDRKKDKLFRGRGVSDDKGGLLQPIHVSLELTLAQVPQRIKSMPAC